MGAPVLLHHYGSNLPVHGIFKAAFRGRCNRCNGAGLRDVSVCIWKCLCRESQNSKTESNRIIIQNGKSGPTGLAFFDLFVVFGILFLDCQN